MTSVELKTEALAWLRFIKRMPYIATEVQTAWNPDVVGATVKDVVEIEVKVSIQDLRAEFRQKEAKLYRYRNAEGFEVRARLPNFMYYMVPLGLEEDARKLLAEKFPQAGLLLYRPESNLAGRNTESVAKPKRLHTGRPDSKFLAEIQMRMASELCGLRESLMKLRQEFSTLVSRVENEVIAKSQLPATITTEGGWMDDVASALARGAGQQWLDLDDFRKDFWRLSAQKWLCSDQEADHEEDARDFEDERQPESVRGEAGGGGVPPAGNPEPDREPQAPV